jgi:uncharacterized protein HemY
MITNSKIHPPGHHLPVHVAIPLAVIVATFIPTVWITAHPLRRIATTILIFALVWFVLAIASAARKLIDEAEVRVREQVEMAVSAAMIKRAMMEGSWTGIERTASWQAFLTAGDPGKAEG